MVDGLEVPRQVLNHQLLELCQHLDHDGDRQVLLEDDTEELLDGSLLNDIPRQLLHHGGEVES